MIGDEGMETIIEKKNDKVTMSEVMALAGTGGLKVHG